MLTFGCFLAIPVVQTRRKIKRCAADTKQRAQLYSTRTALELHADDFEDYPPSDANDPIGVPYSGAMKLAEAIMGQNLFGFHPKSVFRVDGLSRDGGKPLYPVEPNEADLKGRRGRIFCRRTPMPIGWSMSTARVTRGHLTRISSSCAISV
jgi:hypothetical protein